MFNNYKKNNEINTEVSDFIEENYANDTIGSLKNPLMQTEIKNALQSSAGRVPKSNLKVHTFVIDMLIYFPKSDIQYETYHKRFFYKCSSFN